MGQYHERNAVVTRAAVISTFSAAGVYIVSKLYELYHFLLLMMLLLLLLLHSVFLTNLFFWRSLRVRPDLLNFPQRRTFENCWHKIFYRLDAIPVARPTTSKHWKVNLYRLQNSCLESGDLFLPVMMRLIYICCCRLEHSFLEVLEYQKSDPDEPDVLNKYVSHASFWMTVNMKIYKK